MPETGRPRLDMNLSHSQGLLQNLGLIREELRGQSDEKYKHKLTEILRSGFEGTPKFQVNVEQGTLSFSPEELREWFQPSEDETTKEHQRILLRYVDQELGNLVSIDVEGLDKMLAALDQRGGQEAAKKYFAKFLSNMKKLDLGLSVIEGDVMNQINVLFQNAETEGDTQFLDRYEAFQQTLAAIGEVLTAAKTYLQQYLEREIGRASCRERV